MLLKEWLKKEDMTQARFCRKYDLDPVHLSRMINGKIKATLEFAKRIVDATNGEVTYEDLLKGAPKQENKGNGK